MQMNVVPLSLKVFHRWFKQSVFTHGQNQGRAGSGEGGGDGWSWGGVVERKQRQLYLNNNKKSDFLKYYFYVICHIRWLSDLLIR